MIAMSITTTAEAACVLSTSQRLGRYRIPLHDINSGTAASEQCHVDSNERTTINHNLTGRSIGGGVPSEFVGGQHTPT